MFCYETTQVIGRRGKGCTCCEYESFAAKVCLCSILCFAVKTVTKIVYLKKIIINRTETGFLKTGAVKFQHNTLMLAVKSYSF